MGLIQSSQVIEGLMDLVSFRADALVQATAASTLTLIASSKMLTVFTGTTTGQIVVLPNATTVQVGHHFEIWNASTAQITVNLNGGTLFQTLNPGQRLNIYCQSNSTAPGVWVKEITLNSAFGGAIVVTCSYTANAGVGRYLEWYPSNPSDTGPFLVIANGTIIALSVVANAAGTATVSVFKTSDLVNAITSISLSSAASGSSIGLNIPVNAGDLLAVRITSGSLQKPGFGLYLAYT
jgi:hypothetical protein